MQNSWQQAECHTVPLIWMSIVDFCKHSFEKKNFEKKFWTDLGFLCVIKSTSIRKIVSVITIPTTRKKKKFLCCCLLLFQTKNRNGESGRTGKTLGQITRGSVILLLWVSFWLGQILFFKKNEKLNSQEMKGRASEETVSIRSFDRKNKNKHSYSSSSSTRPSCNFIRKPISFTHSSIILSTALGSLAE